MVTQVKWYDLCELVLPVIGGLPANLLVTEDGDMAACWITSGPDDTVRPATRRLCPVAFSMFDSTQSRSLPMHCLPDRQTDTMHFNTTTVT